MTDSRTHSTPGVHKEVTATDRVNAGRRFAQWHLGDPNWYDILLSAAADPEKTIAALKAEGYDTVDSDYGR